jgi:RNA polymerase sigma factor (sigma-70 family)
MKDSYSFHLYSSSYTQEKRKKGLQKIVRGNSNDEDEIELIHRARCGNHDAYQQLVIAYEAKLLAYLIHLLGDRESARDIAQETFIAAFHALPRWTPPKTKEVSNRDLAGDMQGSQGQVLAPWLYRIATNRALNLLNRQPVYSRLPEYDTQEQVRKEGMRHGGTIEDRIVARELLREALSQLTELDAACLVLRFVTSASYAEIGTQLDITKEAARKRVTRGLVALRAAYHTLDMEVQA